MTWRSSAETGSVLHFTAWILLNDNIIMIMIDNNTLLDNGIRVILF